MVLLSSDNIMICILFLNSYIELQFCIRSIPISEKNVIYKFKFEYLSMETL